MGIALVGLFLDIVELIEHQQSLLQTFCSLACNRCVVQQVHHRADVVATQHGAQQLGGAGAGNQCALFGAVSHGSQVTGLDLRGVINSSGDAMGDEVHQRGFFTLGWRLQEFNQLARLLGGQG